MPIIRPSQDSDIPAITAIYAHHVRYGTGTFEVDPPSTADMASRRDDVQSKGLPYLVAVEGPGCLASLTATGSNHGRPIGFRLKIPSIYPLLPTARAWGARYSQSWQRGLNRLASAN